MLSRAPRARRRTWRRPARASAGETPPRRHTWARLPPTPLPPTPCAHLFLRAYRPPLAFAGSSGLPEMTRAPTSTHHFLHPAAVHLSSHPHPISPPGPCQPARIVLPLALAATPPPRAPPEAGPPLAYLTRLNVPAPCRPVLSRVLAHPGHHPLHHLPPGKPPPHTPSLFSCYSPGPPEHPPAPGPPLRSPEPTGSPSPARHPACFPSARDRLHHLPPGKPPNRTLQHLFLPRSPPSPRRPGPLPCSYTRPHWAPGPLLAPGAPSLSPPAGERGTHPTPSSCPPALASSSSMPCLALPEPPPANLAPTPPHRTGLFFSLTPPVHQKPRTPAQNLCYPPAPPEITRAPALARIPPSPSPPTTARARRLTRAPAHCRRSASRRPAACRHPTAGEHQRTLAAHPARSPAPYRFTRTTNPYRLPPPPAPAALPHALSLPAHSPPYPGVNHQPRTPTQNLCYPPPHRAGPCCLGRPRSPAYLASPHPAPARAARQQGESPAPDRG